jgi:hypothetical protein
MISDEPNRRFYRYIGMSRHHTKGIDMKKASKSAVAVAETKACSGNHDDPEYDTFLAGVQKRFDNNTKNGTEPLFTTDTENLFAIYLSAIPAAERGYHNCHACRRFIDRFGGLVTISDSGISQSAIWDVADAPDLYKPAIRAMLTTVTRAKVNGVFICSEKQYGTPTTGDWNHLALSPQPRNVFKDMLKTAFQASAEKSEDFKTVTTALTEFTQQTLEQAVSLLKNDALYRSEKTLGPAQWLLDLHAARSAVDKRMRPNVVWRAIATAPAGFCHPRSSMIGSLLEDIASGMSADAVSRRFASKMHPLQYQRPQAAPSQGTIAQAEKIVEKLKAAGSLLRRFCRVDEVKAIWEPKETKQPANGGVFGHLSTKKQASPAMSLQSAPIVMTWDKFRRTVLDSAEQIDVFAKHGSDSYAALVTAVNPESPPILQWDLESERNPVSWYLWNGGSLASQFGLSAGKFHKVVAVTLKPSMWAGEDKFTHQGNGVLFLIEGAKDTRDAGAAIFPEILKSDFHGVRSVIEAYSRSSSIQPTEGQHACGLMLSGSGRWDSLFRVTSGGVITEYKIDRWD